LNTLFLALISFNKSFQFKLLFMVQIITIFLDVGTSDHAIVFNLHVANCTTEHVITLLVSELIKKAWPRMFTF